MTDQALWAAYLADRSQDLFAQIVARHVNMVYGAARRQLRDDHAAQDVTQEVFLALVRKAPTLDPATPLAAWLFRATRLASLAARRAMARRRVHEKEASMAKPQTVAAGPDWPLISAEIDAAVDTLSAPERHALVLRFFAARTHSEIAVALAISEEAAKKRVQRALEALRKVLATRGIGVPEAALGETLTANAFELAPAAVAASIIKAAGAMRALPRPRLHSGMKYAGLATVAAMLLAALIISFMKPAEGPPMAAATAPAPETAPSAPGNPAPATAAATAPAWADLKTIHIRETTYSYHADQEFPLFTSSTLMPQEWWFDLVHNRRRSTSFMSGTRADNSRILERNEQITADGLSFQISHSRKTVTYVRKSPLDTLLECRQIIRSALYKYQNDDMKTFTCTGRQMIDGRPYDTWERLQTLTNPGRFAGYELRLEVWLSPETRQCARDLLWERPNATSDWRPSAFWTTIEPNATLDDKLFEQKTPAGYTAANTPQTATESSISRWSQRFPKAGNAGLIAHVGFMLPDGVIIFPWGIIEGTAKIPPETFTTLQPGDPLPQLPVKATQLTTLPDVARPEKIRTYLARHLAMTTSKGKSVEWVLYLPLDRQLSPPLAGGYLAWACIQGTPGLTQVNPIHVEALSTADFDGFVGQAMKELSDDGKPPAGISYDAVDKLARRLIPELPATAPSTAPATTSAAP